MIYRQVALVSMVPGRSSRRSLSSSVEGASGRLPEVHGWHDFYHPAPYRSVNLHGIFLAMQSSHICRSIHDALHNGFISCIPIRRGLRALPTWHWAFRLIIIYHDHVLYVIFDWQEENEVKAYILSGLQDLAIAGRHGYTMSLPHPFILWVEEEIKNLKVMEESTWMFGDSHMWMIRDHRERKRIMWLIEDRRELIYDLHYGWKLHCCRQVMSDGPANVVDEVVPMLLAATQDMKLQDAYHRLAYELPVQYVIRAVADFLPQDYAHSLGLPAGMDQPFHRLKIVCGFTRRSHASNQACSPEHCIQTKHIVYFYHMDSKNERELYTVQAYYHRIARLIILEASLTTLSADNGPIVTRLKDGICTLIRWCAITYSLRRGDCSEIPHPIVQWVERYIEELNNKLQRVEQDIQESGATLKDASGSDIAKEEERKRLVEVIEDYDKMIHGTIDYM